MSLNLMPCPKESSNEVDTVDTCGGDSDCGDCDTDRCEMEGYRKVFCSACKTLVGHVKGEGALQGHHSRCHVAAETIAETLSIIEAKEEKLAALLKCNATLKAIIESRPSTRGNQNMSSEAVNESVPDIEGVGVAALDIADCEKNE